MKTQFIHSLLLAFVATISFSSCIVHTRHGQVTGVSLGLGTTGVRANVGVGIRAQGRIQGPPSGHFVHSSCDGGPQTVFDLGYGQRGVIPGNECRIPYRPGYRGNGSGGLGGQYIHTGISPSGNPFMWAPPGTPLPANQPGGQLMYIYNHNPVGQARPW